MIMTKIPGERGVEAEVGESGEDQDEESPERRDRTLEDDFDFWLLITMKSRHREDVLPDPDFWWFWFLIMNIMKSCQRNDDASDDFDFGYNEKSPERSDDASTWSWLLHNSLLKLSLSFSFSCETCQTFRSSKLDGDNAIAI